MNVINDIRLSGVTYDLGDYNTLSGDVQNISGDILTVSGDVIALETKLDTLSGNVYTKSETSSKTEISDALDLKQNVLTAGENITISGNVISATGGGSLNLPIDNGAGIHSLIFNDLTNNTANGIDSNAFGYDAHANGNRSAAFGLGCTANGNTSFVGGVSSTTNGNDSVAIGYYLETKNLGEAAFGLFNKSTKKSSNPNENTMLSVGVGYNAGDEDVRMNAFEVKYDGSIFIEKNPNGLTEEIIRLQDYLFDGNNYYNKSDVDTKISEVSGDTTIISGNIATLSADVQTVSGDVVILSGNVQNLSGDIITLSGDVEGLEAKLNTLSGNVYTKSETSGKTELDTAFNGKQDTLIAGENITISGNVISATGGGSGTTYTAGRGIDITNDVISFNLAVYGGESDEGFPSIALCSANSYNMGINALAEGAYTNANGEASHAEGEYTTAGGDFSHAEGENTRATGSHSHAEGNLTIASGDWGSHVEGAGSRASGNASHAEGYKTSATSEYSHAEGYNTTASGTSSHAEGSYTVANNGSEHASGQLNISSSSASTFGHSGNTLYSIGNGYFPGIIDSSIRHNAFEIRQSGDIYIPDTNASGGYYEKPMIKLQDAISNKPNVWCGDETAWSQISGSTEQGTIYLVY